MSQSGASIAWDEHAARYTREMKTGPMMTPIRAMLKSMDEASPFATSYGIVDVGCGPGSAINELLEAYGAKIPQSTKLVASDYSKGMVEQVEQLKAKHSGDKHWDRLETHVWDLQNLDHVADDSFSHIMASLVFFMLPEPRQALIGTHRVLKEDGLIALTSWHKVEWMEALEAAAKVVRPDLASGRKAYKVPEEWTTTEGVAHELEMAGFKHVRAEYVDTWMQVDDWNMIAQWFIKGAKPLVANLAEGLTEEERDAVCEEYVKIVHEMCPNPPQRLKGVAIVATGRKA